MRQVVLQFPSLGVCWILEESWISWAQFWGMLWELSVGWAGEGTGIQNTWIVSPGLASSSKGCKASQQSVGRPGGWPRFGLKQRWGTLMHSKE